jgi:Protein of unknown function (DUF2934)
LFNYHAIGIKMTLATVSRDQKITALAHKIWEEEGCPEGQAEAHWAKAVAMVDAQTPKKIAKKTPTKANKK